MNSSVRVSLLTETRPGKKHATRLGRHLPYIAQRINGVQLPGEQPIRFHERFTSTPWADRLRALSRLAIPLAVTEVAMREDRADRLGKFCMDYLATGNPDFSCKTFTNYICGFTDTVESPGATRTYYYTDPVQALEPGEPYIVMRNEVPEHAMLGANHPKKAFGVVGHGMPLEIIDLAQIGQIFGGEVHPLQSSAPVDT